MLMQADTSLDAAKTQDARPVLALNGVTKTFPGVTALSEVSLELFPGQVTALV